jgi:hypothetical protein
MHSYAHQESEVISSSYKELTDHSNEHHTPYVFCYSTDTKNLSTSNYCCQSVRIKVTAF